MTKKKVLVTGGGFAHKDEDSRKYKVNFDKIRNVLKFRPTKTARDGIEEIVEFLRRGDT